MPASRDGSSASTSTVSSALSAPLRPRRVRTVVSRPPTGTTRVLHLVSSALPEIVAGYTLRTQGIAAAQRRAGHDAHVVTRVGFPVTRGHLFAEAEVTVDGVPHHRLLPVRLPFRADAALRADVERAARLVVRLRPTVLHAHSNHANGQVGLALRDRFGIPLVYEVRGLLEETWRSRSDDAHAASGSDFYRLTRAAETAVMRGADAVVVLNDALRDEVVDRGVPAERVHVVPNCVDRSWLDLPTAPPGDRPGLTVGLVGTLNAYEGLDVLVEAVARRRAAGDDVRLLVVGDGPARDDLIRLAAERGLGDAATFTGRIPHDEVRGAYAQLDVFCLPRLDLPVTRLVPPLKPVEAMALGIPVVASDLAPLRELVGSDRGALVRPGDPDALAAALATWPLPTYAVSSAPPRAPGWRAPARGRPRPTATSRSTPAPEERPRDRYLQRRPRRRRARLRRPAPRPGGDPRRAPGRRPRLERARHRRTSTTAAPTSTTSPTRTSPTW